MERITTYQEISDFAHYLNRNLPAIPPNIELIVNLNTKQFITLQQEIKKKLKDPPYKNTIENTLITKMKINDVIITLKEI